MRRRAAPLELVSLSGADPVTLAGIVTPGRAVPRVIRRTSSGQVLHPNRAEVIKG